MHCLGSLDNENTSAQQIAAFFEQELFVLYLYIEFNSRILLQQQQTTMASTARLAVRFFGTVHARVHAVRKEGADMFTPERFPAFLAATCVTGLIVGWQIMDRIQNAAVRGVALLSPDIISMPFVSDDVSSFRFDAGTRAFGKVRTR